MDDIKTLTELIQMYDKDQLTDGCLYNVYFTESHKLNKKVGYIDYNEIAGYSELQKEFKKAEYELWWNVQNQI